MFEKLVNFDFLSRDEKKSAEHANDLRRVFNINIHHLMINELVRVNYKHN